jgi:capsid protein
MAMGIANLAEVFQHMRGDYNAAKQSRFRRRLTGVCSTGSSADYHIRNEYEYLRMIEQARAFDRDNCVIGQGVNRLVDNVVQGGFALDPQTGDPEANKLLAGNWLDWSTDPEKCHSAGELTWHQIERLAMRHPIVDGDICLLPLKNGTIEAVEGHRLRTPSNTRKNVVCGVLLGDDRRRLEYWFTKDDISPLASLSLVSDIKAYKARGEDGNKQVFHIYLPRRFTQTRGITAFAPVVDSIEMHDSIQFAKMVQQQVASCFAIIHERSSEFNSGDPDAVGEEYTESKDGYVRRLESIAPGLDIAGAVGEKITGFSPNIPNPEFFMHATMILTFIAINLNLPVAVLLLDPSATKGGFSSWRGAIDQARQGFRELQRWLSEFVHQPVYRWKVRQWIESDPAVAALAARLGPAIFKHVWNPPTWDYIEPKKDAEADTLRLDKHLISPRRLHAERGRKWHEIVPEIVADRSLLIEAGLEAARKVNTKYPEAKVDWHEFVTPLTAPAPAPTTEQDADEEAKLAADDGKDDAAPAAEPKKSPKE